MAQFDITAVDADGTTEVAEAVDAAGLNRFFANYLVSVDILEVGGSFTVKVVN